MSMARGSELACIFAVNYSDLEGVLTQYMVKSDLFLVECCRDIFKDRQEPVVCALSVTDLVVSSANSTPFGQASPASLTQQDGAAVSCVICGLGG